MGNFLTAKKEKAICKICKREFYSRYKIVKTCSKSCASKYRSITVKKGLKKKYKKLCCICKKPFKTNLKKARCCGTKCGSKLASRNRINNYKKYGT